MNLLISPPTLFWVSCLMVGLAAGVLVALLLLQGDSILTLAASLTACAAAYAVALTWDDL